MLWIRDSSGRWHTRTNGVSPMWGYPEIMLWLACSNTPPARPRGTAWIDVVATTGPSAEVRARLPLSWE